MSTVIKIGERIAAARGVVFNFDDIARQADRYLDEVRAQASQIVANARAQAETIRRQSEQHGRQAALDAAKSVLEAKVGKQLETLVPTLNEAVAAIGRSQHAWLDQWEKSAVHLAAAMAARVIRRELTRQPDVPAELVREALELSVGSPSLTVRLNPADHEALEPHVRRLSLAFSRLAPAQIVADASVTPGGCRVETNFGAIDQTFEAQLARIEEELTN